MVTAVVLLLLPAGCRSDGQPAVGTALLRSASATGTSDLSGEVSSDLELARSEPLAFLQSCIDHYDRTISSYRCTFLVHERLRGSLGPEQELDIVFQEKPFSVDVRWRRGSTGAARVNYVAGRWVWGNKELAYVEPSGVLGLLTPGGVRRHIHAPDVLAASRRPIDKFGFRNTLAVFVDECRRAERQAGYGLTFIGVERFDGHACYVLERTLPPGFDKSSDAERRQRMFIDVERLVPRGCFSYCDTMEKELLGSYVARDIEFNGAISDADFSVP